MRENNGMENKDKIEILIIDTNAKVGCQYI